MDHEALHRRAREKGVNPVVLLIVRAILTPLFLIYLQMKRIGREHIPSEGPVILASNHRSFFDPFVIGTMTRRPVYYVAKEELFAYNRLLSWLLNALGAFPVTRGAGDQETIETAKIILGRGEIVLMFPEGTRTRPGALGKPKRGVGRLALETGAPVVPIAIIGTEDIRRGWRIRPRKVRLRAGPALRFPRVEQASPALAGAVTDRIWPCVMLQWEWLGGMPPIRRAGVIGAGSAGTSLAVLLASAGFEVELGCRTREQAAALAAREPTRSTCPTSSFPDSITILRAAELELESHDLICLAVPARALPASWPPTAKNPDTQASWSCRRASSRRSGTLPVGVRGRAVRGPRGGGAGRSGRRRRGARARRLGRARLARPRLSTPAGGCAPSRRPRRVDDQRRDRRRAGRLPPRTSRCSPRPPRRSPDRTWPAPPPGKVFAEVDALARARGGRPETFAGLAGAGDLVATVVSPSSRNRRAGELLAQGVPGAEIDHALGHAVEGGRCGAAAGQRRPATLTWRRRRSTAWPR